MGIKNLLRFVKPMVVTVHIKDFAGQTCTVDASCWLHKGLAISYKEFGDDRRYCEANEIYMNMENYF